MSSIALNKPTIKLMAERLRTYLRAGGTDLKQTNAYEAIARVLGYRDWNTLSAEENWQIANVTTPAQYFHMLRRQMRQEAHKPLIVMTPKSLLRSPQAVSTIDEFTTSGFQAVLPDTVANADGIKRLVLCSGKVYYDLNAEVQQQSLAHVALARVEQFYPFPKQALEDWFAQFVNATEIVWAQEEPQNMGGWTFMQPRLEALTGRRKVRYAGRSASASPSTGNYIIHGLEQAKLVKDALGIK